MDASPSTTDGPPRTVTARWIVPIDRPPVEHGRLTIHGGRIVGLDRAGGTPTDEDFGDAAILPGLVNAHTHLDLTGLRGQAPPTPDFTRWLRQVIAFRRARPPDQVADDIGAGVAECVRFGTTLVGDISGDGLSWNVLANAPLRAVVYREFLGLPAARASAAWEQLDHWLAARNPTPTCRPGVSPHAPYSTRASLFLAASTRGWPVATHLAETPAELELLNSHGGPFADFLKELGVWAPDGLADSVDHVLRMLNGSESTLIVHGNYLAPDAKLPPDAAIVYCPRTHAAFGHSEHPFRHFLARGVRVALGTDSLASNPDLDLLAEARFLHERFPDVPAEAVLRMATLAGAEGMGLGAEAGSLASGKSADFVVIPLDPAYRNDPCRGVLESHQAVARVYCCGTRVYPAGSQA